ncbi:MAG TPA: DHH family phosphoesterase [Saprospiraceae bacterium]|nr:DHH family phosphoesterase [Saprospiraceae bacterium]
MEGIQELKNLLHQPRNIVILSHRNPDGDAVGSSLGLKNLLSGGFHTCTIILPSEFPDEVSWMRGANEIIIYDKSTDIAAVKVKAADVFFCLDFNALDRIDRLGELVEAQHKPIVTIDHHLYPQDFSEILFSKTDVSSTCELVYLVAKAAGWDRTLDKDGLEALLTGIITDTGSFMYNVHPSTFDNVSELTHRGADIHYIQDRLNNHIKEKQLRLLGHCLSNRMKIWPEKKSGLIYLTKTDYQDFNIIRGDTEGIVNYLLKLHDVHVACFISEQPSINKISLRSKGNFSVEKMAKTYFKGGGHKNAAGGSAYGSLSNMITLLEKAIDENKNEIINSY